MSNILDLVANPVLHLAPEMKECIDIFMKMGGVPIPLKNKIPTHDYKNLTPEAGLDLVRHTKPESIGMVIPDGIVVVDNDSVRPDKDTEVNTFQLFLDDYNVNELPLNTPIVQTGSGGEHMFFRIPLGQRCRKNGEQISKRYKYIDFKGPSQFFVIPGSVRSDGSYKLVSGSFNIIPDLPEPLWKAMCRPPLDIGTLNSTSSYLDDTTGISMFSSRLSYDIEISEGERNNRIHALACLARDYAISPAKCLEIMYPWNETCVSPPLGQQELKRTITSAYASASLPLGCKHPSVLYSPSASGGNNDVFALGDHVVAPKKKDALPNTLVNGVALLSQTQGVRGHLWFNSLLNATTVHARLPWDKQYTPAQIDMMKKWGYRLWNKDDSYALRVLLECVHGFVPTTQASPIMIATRYSKTVKTYNPLSIRVGADKWDGIPRISTFFTRYCGVKEHTRYLELVGELLFKGLMARAFAKSPVKFDYMIILEGSQDIGKTTLCELLAFDDFYMNIVKKIQTEHDIKSLHQGRIVIEFDELATMRYADVEWMKGFITSKKDPIRTLFSDEWEDLPRRFILIGTTNPNQSGAYLKDQTGNRRYLPVKLGYINFKDVERDRDQLCSEALYRLEVLKEKIYIDNPDDKIIVRAEQNKRTERDSISEDIEDIVFELTKRPDFNGHVFFSDIKSIATTRGINRLSPKRIDAIMGLLGWGVLYRGHRITERYEYTTGSSRPKSAYWHPDAIESKTLEREQKARI